MGVAGLLPYVKKACYNGNLSEFKGQTLLVDVSCLLHRGVFGCAGKLATGVETELYIGYVNKYVKLLLAQNCHVILVFDGRPLPAKKSINDSRRESREKYQNIGAELLSQGLTAEAHRAFSKGVMLTREVIEKTIKAFNKVPNVDTIVSPYEADAQMAYMMRKGFAHAVITEDSDLIVFGCEKIIFKMDPNNGGCVVYEKEKLQNCVCPVLQRRFDFNTFRRICILAGCDYLQGGLQGVGLKTAEEVFAKTSQTNLPNILSRLQLYTNKRLKVKVDKEFVESFIKAENTFLYQVVFDPIIREQRPLNPYPDTNLEEIKENMPTFSNTKYQYAGKVLSRQKALRLALGNENISASSLEDVFVLPSNISDWSIWNEKYKNVLEREKERKEHILDVKFGAFKPAKPPLKRSAPIVSSLINTSFNSCQDEIEVAFAKKRRFSEIKIGKSEPRNGVYINWTAKDWMRMYGHFDSEQDNIGERSQGSSSTGEGSSQSSEIS